MSSSSHFYDMTMVYMSEEISLTQHLNLTGTMINVVNAYCNSAYQNWQIK